VFRTYRVYVIYLAIPRSFCRLAVVKHKFRKIVMHNLGLDVVVIETVEMHRKRSSRAQYCTMESITDLVIINPTKCAAVHHY
jgi:hypothetical protein